MNECPFLSSQRHDPNKTSSSKVVSSFSWDGLTTKNRLLLPAPSPRSTEVVAPNRSLHSHKIAVVFLGRRTLSSTPVSRAVRRSEKCFNRGLLVSVCNPLNASSTARNKATVPESALARRASSVCGERRNRVVLNNSLAEIMEVAYLRRNIFKYPIWETQFSNVSIDLKCASKAAMADENRWNGMLAILCVTIPIVAHLPAAKLTRSMDSRSVSITGLPIFECQMRRVWQRADRLVSQLHFQPVARKTFGPVKWLPRTSTWLAK